MTFKVGDKVRWLGGTSAPSGWQYCTVIKVSACTIHVVNDDTGLQGQGAHDKWVLTPPPGKSDQELADEYRHLMAEAVAIRKGLEDKGYSLKLDGITPFARAVSDTSRIKFCREVIKKDVI